MREEKQAALKGEEPFCRAGEEGMKRAFSSEKIHTQLRCVDPGGSLEERRPRKDDRQAEEKDQRLGAFRSGVECGEAHLELQLVGGGQLQVRLEEVLHTGPGTA